MSELYELVAYCDGDELSCAPVLDYIERDKRYFAHRLYSQHALFKNTSFTVKYYGLLLRDGRSLENMVLVESKVPTYCLHIHNGIPIKAYHGHEQEEDRELVYLASSLAELATVASVQLTLGTMVRSTILQQSTGDPSHSAHSDNLSDGCSGSVDT